MSEQSGSSQGRQERTELPIERGFPIERVNEIAEKEGRAKQYYRPVYTMHKWWARRLGCVFRAAGLYSLLDPSADVEVFEPGESSSLSDFGGGRSEIEDLISSVSMTDPESLWDLYPKDVRVKDKKVLDPFMGGGTSLVESSRFGAELTGNDLNPIAWFVTKKELEAGETSRKELESAFSDIKENVAEDIKEVYKTECPNGDHYAESMYYFWVKELDCVSCDNTVQLFNDYRVAKGRYENDDKYNVFCPSCEHVVSVNDWKSQSPCPNCGFSFNPSEGNVDRSGYSCTECGQKYGITDAVPEQDGFGISLYAVEYYCAQCDEAGREKSAYKGYKQTTEYDLELYQKAKSRLSTDSELENYIPSDEIRPGWSTDATQFEGSMSGNGNLPGYGYTHWRDMFNSRQLYGLSTILREIDDIDNQNVKEYLLLAISDSLRYNNMMIGYHHGRNHIHDMFKTNSFDNVNKPSEANIWGAEYGMGSFQKMFDLVAKGVEYANEPSERHVENGETKKVEGFKKKIGGDYSLHQGDIRDLNLKEDEYDLVLTDPPYYNNVHYAELSDFFYVWQKLLLEGEYDGFGSSSTPHEQSIESNPAIDKGIEEFEAELSKSFEIINRTLKKDGALVFTYHHSDSESWGELLEALCDQGFEVTATYPITADINKFTDGEAVTFDIIVVARPAIERSATSWNALRREIYRTARLTRGQLEENRDLSRGDIGVMEMGACFREYSKHHGKVQRDGEIMTAKEVVQEIYGIIQEASDIGVEDVFIDLLDTGNVSYDDVNKLCRGTNATPEDLKETHLYNQDDGFELGTWDNEKRQAYIQERVNGDGGDHLSNLDKLQFLRYRYEKGQAVQNYVEKWDVDDDLRELAGRLADVTGDDTYTRVLGDRDITSY